jgi:Zn-dependent protease with chaperone function
MVNALSHARSMAQRIRFSGDSPYADAQMAGARSETLISQHFQDAIEICEELTPSLWGRLKGVCERLHMPTKAVVAFIYSSPVIQAECLACGETQCMIRCSSAMLDLLTEEEFEFVIGHEIGHFLLDHQGGHQGN